jgi:hypothetical protein
MREPLADGYAELDTEIGGHRESAQARLWRGQVLVDWERDEAAGGCLVRPELVQRLLALNATARVEGTDVVVTAGPRVVASLSERHARLAAGVQPAPTLSLRLRFDGPDGAYTGGEERYEAPAGVSRRTARPTVVLRLRARVHAGAPRPASPRTSTAPS